MAHWLLGDLEVASKTLPEGHHAYCLAMSNKKVQSGRRWSFYTAKPAAFIVSKYSGIKEAHRRRQASEQAIEGPPIGIAYEPEPLMLICANLEHQILFRPETLHEQNHLHRRNIVTRFAGHGKRVHSETLPITCSSWLLRQPSRRLPMVSKVPEPC